VRLDLHPPPLARDWAAHSACLIAIKLIACCAICVRTGGQYDT
jgi:hypothetical protein